MNEKKVKIIAAVILTEIVAGILMIVIFLNTPAHRYKALISLGYKYLSEMDFEDAVLTFNSALEIKDDNREAREGLFDSYKGWGDYLADNREYDISVEKYREALKISENSELYSILAGVYIDWSASIVKNITPKHDDKNEIEASEIEDKYKKDIKAIETAIEILEEGYQVTRDDRLKQEIAKLNELKDQIEAEHNKQIIGALANGFCEKLAAYCAVGDYENAYEMLAEDDFAAIISSMENNAISDRLIFETTNDPVGFYRVNSELYGNYMVYCGKYADNKRDGYGVWLGYKESQHYYALGEWKNDFPNGEQTMREWNGIMAEGVTIREISGNVKNGLWDGYLIWGFEGERVHKWNVTAHKGVIEVLREDIHSDGQTYYVWAEETISGEDSGALTTTNSYTYYGIEGFYQ